MATDTLFTYVVDSFAITKAEKDSAIYKEVYSFKRDIDITSFSFDNQSSKLDSSIVHRDADLKTGHVGQNRLFTLEQDDGVFALLLISFFCITRIYKDSSSFFRENIRLLFSSRESINLFSETTIKEFWFNFILIFQTILLTAIILFDYFLVSDSNIIPHHSFYTICLFIVVISSFLGLKYLLYRLIGWIFDIQPKIDIWLRTYAIVLEMVGVIAFIPSLILIYSLVYQIPVIVFFIALFTVSRIILFYRITMFFLDSSRNILYLITYLCSVEIIPYIFLFYFLEYLYKIDLTSLLWL